ncbi:MAG: hypothetical protein E5X93_29105, partial [Mesorhizobium sp.]|uniref:hypothetical protein n=1 Tax=Mesorhizobium sp. TaxID=1871066 RepID=UPI0012078224
MQFGLVHPLLEAERSDFLDACLAPACSPDRNRGRLDSCLPVSFPFGDLPVQVSEKPASAIGVAALLPIFISADLEEGLAEQVRHHVDAKPGAVGNAHTA